MQSSIELFLKLGVENILRHILHLQDIFNEYMKYKDFIIVSDLEHVHLSNILIFSYSDNTMNDQIQKELERNNIFIALREGFLRLSAHIFNNENDILALTNVLKKISH